MNNIPSPLSLPSDQICSNTLPSVCWVHPDHGDVEHLAGLQFVEHVHVLLPDGLVDGEVGLVQRVRGFFQGLEIRDFMRNWND